MAPRWITSVVVACLALSLASGRVVDSKPPQDDLHARLSINDLLQQADPYENDIFYGPRQEYVAERQPSRPSPTQHLLSSLSRPRYVDASEFRRDILPPSLDINRQLALISASKRVLPPVEVVRLSEKLLEDNVGSVYFPNPSPLFREDFPFQDTDYNYQDYPEEQKPDEADTNLETESVPEKPVYSTSVSVSYSNGSSAAVDHEPSSTTKTSLTTEESEITTSKSKSSTTESTAVESEDITKDAEVEVSDTKVTADSEVSEDRSGKYFGIETLGEYPDYEALSPLSHILAGFRGEIGPFGDLRADDFIRGFRPIGF